MNPATVLARLAVQALAAAGVGHVVLCPGSRSAPLAYELARTSGPGLALHIRHDERVGAFTALGVGLAGRSIGAVVTTSGTAVANLHPAVLEAHHANRPLVVVTADRPPALRGTWANQTSELQARLFGSALRASIDLDDVTAAADPCLARARLCAALAAATAASGGRPGPVHLDLGFSEPLVPDPADDGPVRHQVGVRRRAAGAPAPDAAPGGLPREPWHLVAGPRTVVLAGDGAGVAAREFAEAAGLPLLAEPSSGARSGPNAIGPYRLLLGFERFGGAVERVVVFGRPTLSRPVTRLVARPDVDVTLVSVFDDWPEPGRDVTRCAAVTAEVGDKDWLIGWQTAGRAAQAAIDAVLDGEAGRGLLTGPFLARELWTSLQADEYLVAGASNPIRDLDLSAHPAVDGSPRVVANRGLSGIDGTVSTATGLSLAAGPARVLVGDLAFLHDAGSLLVGPGERRPDLQVVVLNDDGGGIFSLLEYGARAGSGPGRAAEFDRLFGTPHGADLASVCRAFGVRYDRADDAGQLRALLAGPARGLSVVEVRSERAGLRDLHARLRTAAAAACFPS